MIKTTTTTMGGVQRSICAVWRVALFALLLVKTTEAFTTAAPSMPSRTRRSSAGTSAVVGSDNPNRQELPTTTSLNVSGNDSDDENKKADGVGDFYKNLGPIAFVPGYLFIGQICFLIAANLSSGLDNLYLYGDLGNQYIHSHGGYDQSKSFLERQLITQQGQKVWLDNVVRDLQNGGPVTPPLSEPLP